MKRLLTLAAEWTLYLLALRVELEAIYDVRFALTEGSDFVVWNLAVAAALAVAAILFLVSGLGVRCIRLDYSNQLC